MTDYLKIHLFWHFKEKLEFCLVLTKEMNIFPLEIPNVCMFLYVDLHDLGSPSETDRLD